jgi:choloylglycine hydrolase
MKYFLGVSFAISIFVLVVPNQSRACTAFFMSNGEEAVVGKNYDWNVGDGLVIVNKRQVWKPFSFTAENTDNGWTSTYGSVTFNQYGRDMPQGGINEAGLVIEVLWLAGTEYPPDDDRTDLGGAQWIQYQLDTAATVEEVIESFAELQIRSRVPLHFFVADQNGETATVEFVDGKLIYHLSKEMPARVLTNSTYEASVDYLEQHRGFGGSTPVPQGIKSLERFVRAAAEIEGCRSSQQTSVDFAYSVLESVAQADGTQWSIIYDIGERRVYFVTQRSASTKHIDLKKLDFSCSSPVQIMDIDIHAAGSVSDRWEPYTRSANLDLIDRSYAATSFLQNVPQSTKEIVASYPDRSHCTD